MVANPYFSNEIRLLNRPHTDNGTSEVSDNAVDESDKSPDGESGDVP